MTESFTDKGYELMDTARRLSEHHAKEAKKYKQAISLVAEEMLSKASSEDELLEIATQLYWFHEDVPTSIVYAALKTNAYHIQDVLPPVYIPLPCSDCKEPVEVSPRSRNKLKDLRSSSWRGPVCRACTEKRANRDLSNKAKWEAERAAEQAEIQRLKTIPYSEYLKSEHWQNLRRRMLKRASFRCQLCNTQGRLNVHHRTYERRGCEEYSDLIVLCENCHGKFHGKVGDAS